jgi:SAM-dependent methyltransferase
MAEAHQDNWQAGSTYDRFMGRWSRKLAPLFVEWLDVDQHLDWLEVGCGTGSLTHAIVERANPNSVVACDPTPAFIDFARGSVPDSRVRFIEAGADNFPISRNGYDVITSSFALNFFPDPLGGLTRMRSATGPRGLVSACVWDYAEGMQFLRHFWDAALELDVDSSIEDEGARFPICKKENLTQLFRAAGYVDVRCDYLEIETVFASFEDYWEPMTGGTGPAPSFVTKLSSSNVEKLRSTLEARLPRDGSERIPLRARAVAACGRSDLELLIRDRNNY